MGFSFSPAAAPPPGGGSNFAKLQQFVGKLLIIRAYEDNVPSKFKDQQGNTQYQTRATVVPVQKGTWTNPDNGDEAEWEAGEVLDVFISASRVRAQLRDNINKPILGRLLKDGKAWILQEPTDADVAKANEVLKDVELPDKSGSATSAKNDADDGDALPW